MASGSFIVGATSTIPGASSMAIVQEPGNRVVSHIDLGDSAPTGIAEIDQCSSIFLRSLPGDKISQMHVVKGSKQTGGITSFPLGMGDPLSVEITTDSKLMVVSFSGANSLTLLNPATGVPESHVTLSWIPSNIALASSSGQYYLIAMNEDSNKVAIVSLSSSNHHISEMILSNSVPMRGSLYATQLADSNDIAILNYAAKEVDVVDFVHAALTRVTHLNGSSGSQRMQLVDVNSNEIALMDPAAGWLRTVDVNTEIIDNTTTISGLSDHIAISSGRQSIIAVATEGMGERNGSSNGFVSFYQSSNLSQIAKLAVDGTPTVLYSPRSQTCSIPDA